MSAPLAGQFQDHYKVLGIDPKSDAAAIERTWSALVANYQPGAPSADPEKLEAVNQAYEILSDPVLRKQFDKLKGIEEEEGGPKFSGARFFAALGRDSGLRIALLCVLYDRRRSKPFTPSLSMRNIENILIATTEELNLAVWYLKQRNLAVNDDKSSLQITVDGIDFLERTLPAAESVMPFIKPSGLAQLSVPVRGPEAEDFPAAGEPVEVGAGNAEASESSQARSLARLRRKLDAHQKY
jgi:hypothetical protein